MKGFIPDSKQLSNRHMPSGWDAHIVCQTLVTWYPELLRTSSIHTDMRQPRQAMEFLSCLQEYPADLQDIMILLAQRYGVQKATNALDNAIRKFTAVRKRQTAKDTSEGIDPSRQSDRLTA